MRVLMITGDKKFAPGKERYDLQRSAVEDLSVVYWGASSTWPAIPEGAFDVVTVQDPFWRGVFALYVARSKKTKLNVQVHADLKGQSFVKHILAQIVLRHADSVRVVSEKIKQQVEHVKVKGNVLILPIFLDIEKFKRVERKPHPQKTILWIGRLEDEKNPLAAVKIVEEIRKEGVDTKLIMLGQGSLEARLKSRASGLPVEFPGWKDLTSYLEVADVVISTSSYESWGASMIEALAAGVPVVAPDVGVAKEAGANVVAQGELAQEVIRVLQAKQKGELKLNLPSKEEWAVTWRESLGA